MRFLGSVRMRTLGWLAIGVVGGLSACGENDNLEPVETGTDSTSTGTSSSTQATTTTTGSSVNPSTGATSTAHTSSTSTATTTSAHTSSTASTATSTTSTSTQTRDSSTTTAASSTNTNMSSADETSDEASETSEETSAAETSGGGGKPPPDPSEGCGKASPATGTSGQPLTVSGHQYYVKLPQNYDPATPYPVVMMFNPTGNPITWAEQSAGFEAAAKDAIRIYPHMANQSSGWGTGDTSFFQPFYDKITADYCIDKARIFAGGESSGGEFVGYLGCDHADKLRAVAPGAPKPFGNYALSAAQRECTGQVLAVVIHSPKDNVLTQPVGEQMRDFYKELNHCTEMSEPVEGYTDMLSNCVMFQGCDEGYPVYWCHHNDPEYSNTYHGWPHFAAKMLWETWSQL